MECRFTLIFACFIRKWEVILRSLYYRVVRKEKKRERKKPIVYRNERLSERCCLELVGKEEEKGIGKEQDLETEKKEENEEES